MTANGTLKEIPGGIQPVEPDYSVYGSCVYKSPKTGKQYLFVNEKSARYLQYELTSTSNGTLQTKLVRDFTGGSGGQVEGCVTDEDNGWIFLGEEPSALWRYGAEPDSKEAGLRIAYVGDGQTYADVEGVTLVYGTNLDQGYVIVSNQGVSAYNVYKRAEPHEYVTTFTITKSSDGQVDAVSNTDGITAVGTQLGKDFPHGLVVTHDDANQLPDGSTSTEASFKLVSLEKVLGSDALKSLNLLDDVDTNWNPRK
ncbi:3-phytase [Colletotrichum liriopes]|uniref:3-phytase n=1 Tax=Colletotrichum liriopes TaxID=708192 RepID=A0AA37LSW8_9PEZI|nr:3-phytase [Colletotrichum liriopes]